MNEGKRFDAGKSRVDLIPTDALESLGEVYAYGVGKYGERNWEKGMAWGRVIGSLFRHAYAFWRGEDRDEESGLLHTQHIAWNAVALLAYQLRRAGEDNRAKCISAAITPGPVITHHVEHSKRVPNRINKGETEGYQPKGEAPENPIPPVGGSAAMLPKIPHIKGMTQMYNEPWAVGDIAESREGNRYVLTEVSADAKVARGISDRDPEMKTPQLINLIHFKKVS